MNEIETFLILKYGSMSDAYHILVTEDARGNYDRFDSVQRRQILDWHYRFDQEAHKFWNFK